MASRAKKAGVVTRIFRLMGPGVITGAADDDPSGIATYSIAGAQFGTRLLWTALVTWPLMGAVQMMCARIGMVTGEGLASGLRKKVPRWICIAFVIALVLANTINVGADLSGMADAAALLTGLNSHVFVVVFGSMIAFVTVKFRYQQIARVLKWLVLSLAAYVVTAFIAHPQWHGVFHDTLVPAWPSDRETWGMVVAILGTTISPYLFFWQAAQEVEEERAKGASHDRPSPGRDEQRDPQPQDRRRNGHVLLKRRHVFRHPSLLRDDPPHPRRHPHHDHPRGGGGPQAAGRPLRNPPIHAWPDRGRLLGDSDARRLRGLRRFAGDLLTGGEGLDEPYEGAREFYIVLILSIACGIVMDFLKLSPITTLYWTAIINGLLAPFLLVGVYLLATDEKLMKKAR